MRATVPLVGLMCLSPLAAAAAPAIGSAASVEKEVQGITGERSARVSRGDAVFLDETIATGADSRGRFTFTDRTNLQVGPSSRVKLDNFVYSGGSNLGFNTVKGAFRFVSAPGEHRGYEVKTPTATIGVRGTIFAVRATATQTDAVLERGIIEVCNLLGVCRTLDKPCTTVTVTNEGITDPRKVEKKDWSFDGACFGQSPSEQGQSSPPSDSGQPGTPGMDSAGAALAVGGAVAAGAVGGFVGSRSTSGSPPLLIAPALIPPRPGSP